MHRNDEIIRRLESGLTTIEFRRLHAIDERPADAKLAIATIGREINRMNFFLTELHNSTYREGS